MTDDTMEQEISGLARSIQRLFAQDSIAQVVDEDTLPEQNGGEGSDVAWVAESGVRLPGDVHAPEPLVDAVKAYARAEGGERDESVVPLEAAIEDARARRAVGAMADAAEALGHLGGSDPRALELARTLLSPAAAVMLVTRVTDAQDEDRRAELIELLPQLGDEVEVAALGAVQQEALDADADRSARRALLSLVAAMAERGSDILDRMIEDSNWRVARNAVLLAADRDPELALPHLRQALVNSDPRVRKEALSAFSRIGGDEATEVAVAYLGDSDPAVRSQAARAAGLLFAERALKQLIAMLDSETEDGVLIEVIRALGLLGDPSAVIPLEKRAVPSFFGRAPTEVRVAAYRALAAIGTPHASSLIDKAADDKDDQVRRTAQAILKTREG